METILDFFANKKYANDAILLIALAVFGLCAIVIALLYFKGAMEHYWIKKDAMEMTRGGFTFKYKDIKTITEIDSIWFHANKLNCDCGDPECKRVVKGRDDGTLYVENHFTCGRVKETISKAQELDPNNEQDQTTNRFVK